MTQTNMRIFFYQTVNSLVASWYWTNVDFNSQLVLNYSTISIPNYSGDV